MLKREVSLSEIRQAVERAYENATLREKFDSYLSSTHCRAVAEEFWSTELLFKDEYKVHKPNSGWCIKCKIRKRASLRATFCFFCTGRFVPSLPKIRCTFIFPTHKFCPKELIPNPGRNLPGSQCTTYAANGKRCRLHERAEELIQKYVSRNENKDEEFVSHKAVSPNVPKTFKRKMSKYYADVLAPHVTELIKQANQDQASEIYDVREEMIIARQAVKPFIENMQRSEEFMKIDLVATRKKIAELEQKRHDKPEEFSQTDRDTLLKCQVAVRQGETFRTESSRQLLKIIEQLVNIADKGSMIYTRHAEVIDTQVLARVVDRVLGTVYECVGDEHGPRIEQALRGMLNLPKAGGSNTIVIPPSDYLQAMAARMGIIPEDTAQNESPQIPDKPQMLLGEGAKSVPVKVENSNGQP